MDKKSEEIASEYSSSLADLNVNSKPLINMLTILADENLEHAHVIVKTIEIHLAKVGPDIKLPVLYLVDSIVKNVGRDYKMHFATCIVNMFCGTFEKVNERIREKMFNLRQTWNDVFPPTKLYTLDVKVNHIDPNWPITAKVPTKSPAIHVNPNFFIKNKPGETNNDMAEQLRKKQCELLELQKKKLELELMATKKKIEEQEKQINQQASSVVAKQKLEELAASKSADVKKMADSIAMLSVQPPPLPIQRGRIAPANAAIVSSVKSRDPRLQRQSQAQGPMKKSIAPANYSNPMEVAKANVMKMRIPKISKLSESDPRRTKITAVQGSNSASAIKTSSKSDEKDEQKTKSSSKARSSSSDKKKSSSVSPKSSPSKKKRESGDTKSSSKSTSEKGSKYKEERSSSKTKSYSRRNRDASSERITSTVTSTNSSPPVTTGINLPLPTTETGDIDLRLLIPEKKMKMNEVPVVNLNNENDANSRNSTSDQKTIFETGFKDVDLRVAQQIASEPSLSNGSLSPSDTIRETTKKRPSNSNADEPEPKKTKSEKIDVLFGSEDVDLRIVPPNIAVSDVLTPPPPPIISTKEEKNTTVINKAEQPAKTDKANLDAIRAKLLATKKDKDKDKLGRPLLYNKLPDDPKERRESFSNNIETAFRPNDLNVDETSQDDVMDTSLKIIMEQAQEQLKNETINMEQYKTMMNQVIQMSEAEKIRKVQRYQAKLQIIKNKEAHSIEDHSNEDYDAKRQERRNKSPTGDITKMDPAFINDGWNSQQISRDPRRRDGKWSNNRQEPPQNPIWGQRNVAPQLIANTRGRLPNPWEQQQFMNPLNRFTGPAIMNGGGGSGMIMPGLTKSIENMRTINIDGVAREIRFYEDTAIIFMSWDEPKEIGFQMGQRRIIIDDRDTFDLCFNEGYKLVTIEGEMHQMKFGAPTRELYIDNVWYECYFGDQLSISLDGKQRMFKIGGPAPQVKIGNSRIDLVAGKINMIINAEIIIPVFLDAKVQTFELNGQTHTLQFADYLLTVILNDDPYPVEYGGQPKLIKLRGIDYYVRFTAIPNKVVPGRIYIKEMVRTQLQRDLKTPPLDPNDLGPFTMAPIAIPSGSSTTTNVVHVQQPIVHLPIGPQLPPHQPVTTTGLDYLTNILHDTKPSNHSANTAGYQIENVEPAANPANLLGNLNIDALYKKIVAIGLINQPAASDKVKEPEKAKELIVPVDLTKPESVKKRQIGFVEQLFSGMQCSSCGVRFPPEQTMKYSQHLDWHFRQNRRDRDSARRAHSRKWYYDVSDWIQYEEIEDLEEREKNWFELNPAEPVDFNEDSNQKGVESPIPSCPANIDDVNRKCDMCHEEFDQFFNEETEEWHLRNALRIEDKIYHPPCYEDYKASLTLDESALNAADTTNDESKVDDGDTKIKAEGAGEDASKVTTIDGDDDDVIELPSEAPVVTEIIDDDDEEMPEVTDVEKKDESLSTAIDNGVSEVIEDDDVLIQEPHIEVTDLDLIEDKPASVSTNDDSSQMSQSSLLVVKIKEEPKDDSYNEEDAFEDVGTVEPVDDLINHNEDTGDVEFVSSPRNAYPFSAVDTAHTGLIASIDGNVELQEAPTANITNKIRINIAKSSKQQQQERLNLLSTGNDQQQNINDNISDNNLNSNNNELMKHENENVHRNNNKDDELINEIRYDLKPTLEGVVFTKMKAYKGGHEQSGLCSIM